jgi:hypothetical protein
LQHPLQTPTFCNRVATVLTIDQRHWRGTLVEV